MIRTEITGAEIAEEMEKERRLFQLQMCEVRNKFQFLIATPKLIINRLCGSWRWWNLLCRLMGAERGNYFSVTQYSNINNYFNNSFTKLGFFFVLFFSPVFRLLWEGSWAENTLWKYFLFYQVYGFSSILISFFQYAFWSLLKFLIKW